MVKRVNELLSGTDSFAFETTLATRIYKNKIIEAQQNGFNVTLLFFWLESIALAKYRVMNRVSEGGHNIEPHVIARRYLTGISNLLDVYLPMVDKAFIFDNSYGEPRLLAELAVNKVLSIADEHRFYQLKQVL